MFYLNVSYSISRSQKLPGIGSLDQDQDIIMAGSQLIKVFLSHRYYKYHIRINSLYNKT